MHLSPLENLALSVKRLQYRNYRKIDAKLAPLGLSLVQWGAMREIENNPGVCMHHLAELTFNSDQAFGTLMTRLRRQKLVERQPGASRANVHRLTLHGKTLLGEGRKLVRQVLLKTFGKLDASECARLQGLLAKVLGEDNPAEVVPPASRKASLPPTRFLKATVGLIPKPGQPLTHAGARHHKKMPGATPSAPKRKAYPSSGEAN